MIDEIPDTGFDLSGSDDADEKPTMKPITGQIAVFLGDPKVWENYEDRRLAEAESALRAWIEEMSGQAKWRTTSAKCRRYTFSMLFHLVTGEEYDHKKHAGTVRMWSNLFRYYSSRVQKSASINGKQYNKTIYVISPQRLKKPPFSVRLRIPWLAEHGIAIDARTIYGPLNDDLKPGHARNPRTEENMRRRREEGRKRYERRKDVDRGSQGV